MSWIPRQTRLVSAGSGGVMSKQATDILRNMMPKLLARNPTLARSFAAQFNIAVPSPQSEMESGSEATTTLPEYQMVKLDTPAPLDDMALNSERLAMETERLQQILLVKEAKVKEARETLQMKIGSHVDLDEYIDSFVSRKFESQESQALSSVRTLASSPITDLSNSSNAYLISESPAETAHGKLQPSPFKDPNHFFPPSTRARQMEMSAFNKKKHQRPIADTKQKIPSNDAYGTINRTSSAVQLQPIAGSTDEMNRQQKGAAFPSSQNTFFPKSKRVRPESYKRKK